MAGYLIFFVLLLPTTTKTRTGQASSLLRHGMKVLLALIVLFALWAFFSTSTEAAKKGPKVTNKVFFDVGRFIIVLKIALNYFYCQRSMEHQQEE